MSSSTLRNLIQFTVPASAVALASSAKGAVVSTNFSSTITTATDYISIDVGDGLGGLGSASINSAVSGEDFRLSYGIPFNGTSAAVEKPRIDGVGSSVVGLSSSFAAQFANGDAINSSLSTTTGAAIYDANFGGSQWAPGESGYLGVKFSDGSSNQHYAWIGITYGIDGSIALHGVGYETLADTGIIAGATAVPEPASAGLIAAALAGSVALFRRREQRS